MKKTILTLCCFLTILFSQGQTSADLYNRGDSLYKIKDYKNSARAYALSIQQDGKTASVEKYWACACSWSLAGIADSAFHCLDIICRSDKLAVDEVAGIENDHDLIPVKMDQRWQPIIDALHRKILSGVNKLSADVRAGARINPNIDRYNIALAWAMSKNTDSSFSYLYTIIQSNYNRFVDYDELAGEKVFQFLHNDPRWPPLLEEVKKYQLPFTCSHVSHPAGTAMVFTIDPSSQFLKSDGKGSYPDNKDNVVSQTHVAYSLLVSGVNELEQSGNWKDASTRYLVLDLKSPIKTSGAVQQGVIEDHFATFHVFNKIDTTAGKNIIYNFGDIPIGSTLESPRAEIMIHIHGKLHILTFGFWSLGDCGETYGRGGKINGKGTTAVKVTRNSASSYTIEAPNESVGRLWDVDNRTLPIDKGLFKTGFIIHVDNQ